MENYEGLKEQQDRLRRQNEAMEQMRRFMARPDDQLINNDGPNAGMPNMGGFGNLDMDSNAMRRMMRYAGMEDEDQKTDDNATDQKEVKINEHKLDEHMEKRLSEDKELSTYDSILERENEKYLNLNKEDSGEKITDEQHIADINNILQQTKASLRNKATDSKTSFLKELNIPAQDQRGALPEELKEIYALIDEYSGIKVVSSDYAEGNYFSRFFKSIWHWGTSRRALRSEEKKLRTARQKIIAYLENKNISEEHRQKLNGMLSMINERSCMGTGESIEEKTKNKWGDNVEIQDYTKKKISFKYHGPWYERVGGWIVSNHSETRKNDTLLFPHEPCAQDICQGAMGDCFFLSALTDVVKEDPKKIKDMMLDNGDGSVTVRFFKQGENRFRYDPVYIKVDKTVLKLGAADTLWVQIMEKAYAAFLQSIAKKDSKGKSLMPNGNYSMRLKKYNKRMADLEKRKNELMKNDKLSEEEAVRRAKDEQIEELIQRTDMDRRAAEDIINNDKEEPESEFIAVDNDRIEYGFAGNGGVLSDAVGHLTGIAGQSEEITQSKKTYNIADVLNKSYDMGSKSIKSRDYLERSMERLNRRIYELRQDMENQGKKEDEFYINKVKRLQNQYDKMDALHKKFKGVRDTDKIRERMKDYSVVEKNGEKTEVIKLNDAFYMPGHDYTSENLGKDIKIFTSDAIKAVSDLPKYKKKTENPDAMSEKEYKEFIDTVIGKLDDESFLDSIIDFERLGPTYTVLCEDWRGDKTGDPVWVNLNRLIEADPDEMRLIPKDKNYKEKIKGHIKEEIKERLRQTQRGLGSLIKKHGSSFNTDYSAEEMESFDDLEIKVQRGDYVGAGSTEGGKGVVAGHAYSVTNTYRRGGLFLVELRNPHGRAFAEYRINKGKVTRDYNSNIGEEGVMVLEYKDFLASYDHKYNNRKML